MAQDYSSINTFPKPKVFSVSSDPTKPTEVILPATCNKIELGSDGGKIFWSDVGVDDTSISADKAFIVASNYLPIAIGTGKQRINSIFVAGATGSESVTIILYEK